MVSSRASTRDAGWRAWPAGDTLSPITTTRQCWICGPCVSTTIGPSRSSKLRCETARNTGRNIPGDRPPIRPGRADYRCSGDSVFPRAIREMTMDELTRESLWVASPSRTAHSRQAVAVKLEISRIVTHPPLSCKVFICTSAVASVGGYFRPTSRISANEIGIILHRFQPSLLIRSFVF